MSDYAQITAFGPKDSLPTGNASKLVKGVELDAEFVAIAAAITSKYDSSDIASLAEAQAESSGSKLITPQRLGNWADANAGMVGDLQALSAPPADRVLGWDASAGAAVALVAHNGKGLEIDGADLGLNFSGITSLTAASSGDQMALWDVSLLAMRSLTFAGLADTMESLMVHDNIAGAVANEHIDHSSISIFAGTGMSGGGDLTASRTLSLDTSSTRNVDHASVSVLAGNGLSGGGTLAANRTLNVDISGLTNMSGAIAASDSILFNDGGVMKQLLMRDMAAHSRTVSTSEVLVDNDTNSIVWWTGTSGSLTVPTSIAQDNSYIILVNSGSGTLTIAGGGGAVITTRDGIVTLEPGAIGVLIRENASSWFLGGGTG